MGIETNGKYLEKMDIVSSLATLSYDKRRSEFTKELIILLKFVDQNYKEEIYLDLGQVLLEISSLCQEQSETMLLITMTIK